MQIYDKLSLEILKSTAVLLRMSVSQSPVSVDPLSNKTTAVEIARKSQYLSQKTKLGKYVQNETTDKICQDNKRGNEL